MIVREKKTIALGITAVIGLAAGGVFLFWETGRHLRPDARDASSTGVAPVVTNRVHEHFPTVGEVEEALKVAAKAKSPDESARRVADIGQRAPLKQPVETAVAARRSLPRGLVAEFLSPYCARLAQREGARAWALVDSEGPGNRGNRCGTRSSSVG